MPPLGVQAGAGGSERGRDGSDRLLTSFGVLFFPVLQQRLIPGRQLSELLPEQHPAAQREWAEEGGSDFDIFIMMVRKDCHDIKA